MSDATPVLAAASGLGEQVGLAPEPEEYFPETWVALFRKKIRQDKKSGAFSNSS
jgi:hypothetical protein